MRLAGKTCLVTGATKGIGRALVQSLIAAGVRQIVAVGRDSSELEKLVKLYPDRILPLAADLAQDSERLRIVEFVRERAPELSVLINNAGVQTVHDFTGVASDQAYQTIMLEIETNFTAVVSLTIRLLPALLQQSEAMVVNVTSGLALAPKQSSPVYCATKAAVRSFSKALRYQMEARMPHVRMIEALPPLVDTAMTQGRGRGKISPEECARQIILGMTSGTREIYVGKSKLLRTIFGISPSLAERITRKW